MTDPTISIRISTGLKAELDELAAANPGLAGRSSIFRACLRAGLRAVKADPSLLLTEGGK